MRDSSDVLELKGESMTKQSATLKEFLSQLDAFIVQCEDISVDLRVAGLTELADRYGLVAFDAAELYNQAGTLVKIQ